jgi:aminopeptidase N
MKRFVLLSFCALAGLVVCAQPAAGQKAEPPSRYQATPERINNLVHTRLEARFDYSRSQLNGKAWLQLRPHFYPTDSLELDAKGMEIRQVAISSGGKNTPLKYTYDGMVLNVKLNRPYRHTETYTIYIDYTAKPDEYKGRGSAAITDAKGLYFINPKGEDKSKPTQIWTQGETEATSVWVPTIDRPNQRTTQEFFLTVPAKYVTLSNGKLMSQKPNSDGTRTDYWKMDQPHAPYLFFIGVGDYAIIKDQYKGKEVSYYVEKEYAPVARRIFGGTPEMMAYFSHITGVDYPWVKYAQIVGRDYVSGAMENTTATLHQESAQQDARELTDGNQWEGTIAHELFHQWFGDYVTTESWSNLTLNESFANYSEYLWDEYKYGKDKADQTHFSAMQGYLTGNNTKKDLVRFYYNDKEDMFDAVSYNKGGRILHMLRNFVGDSAFFRSLNAYLTANRFKAAEAHQLRLAFEEVTGKDLNWFFNQWYFGAGHPRLNITYGYNESTRQATIVVEQLQTDKLFRLPVKVDVWTGNQRASHSIWVENKIDTFYFPATQKPSLINFDADKILLAQKTENKTLEEYAFQQQNARNYLDRREAIDAAGKKIAEPGAAAILQAGLRDRFEGLRAFALSRIDLKREELKGAAEPLIAAMAEKEPSRPVRAAAIAKLGDYRQARYQPIFLNAINDSSYTVSGRALDALGKIDSVKAYAEARRLSAQPAKGVLSSAITRTMIRFGDESSAGTILQQFEDMPLSQAKFEAMQPLSEFLAKGRNFDNLKRGVAALESFVLQIPENFRGQIAPFVENLLKNLQKAKTEQGLKEQADYLDGRLKKKAF